LFTDDSFDEQTPARGYKGGGTDIDDKEKKSGSNGFGWSLLNCLKCGNRCEYREAEAAKRGHSFDEI